MTIVTVITPLPTPPNPATDDSTTYSSKASTFTQALVTFATQLGNWLTEVNTTQAQMNASQTGAAVGISYTFSTSTLASDPGAGSLRLGSATENASTSLYVSTTSADTTDWSSVLGSFLDSTSTVKGYLKLHKQGDGTKWIAMTFTAMASNTGWKNFTVTVIGSSAANPFNNGDPVVMTFTRNGDAAAGGGAAISDIVNQTQNSGTTGGTSTAFTLTPATASTGYGANRQYYVTFHTTSGDDPTLTISAVATPPNLVKQNADGTYSNIKAGDIPANHRSRVVGISATQYVVEEMPVPDGASSFLTSNFSASFTLAFGDRGKLFVHTSATAHTITIPSNASVALPLGFCTTISNDAGAGALTIQVSSDVLTLVGSGATGTRTLAANGMCTLTKITATRWQISGGGVS
jgi:hypothetical protein